MPATNNPGVWCLTDAFSRTICTAWVKKAHPLYWTVTTQPSTHLKIVQRRLIMQSDQLQLTSHSILAAAQCMSMLCYRNRDVESTGHPRQTTATSTKLKQTKNAMSYSVHQEVATNQQRQKIKWERELILMFQLPMNVKRTATNWLHL
jgi:hypothetical protein